MIIIQLRVAYNSMSDLACIAWILQAYEVVAVLWPEQFE